MSKRKKHHPSATQNLPQGSQARTTQPTTKTRTTTGLEQRIEVETQFQHFSGPLPPPAALENYERIMPGAADRIMKMAEANNTFMIEMDKEIARSQFIERRLGQYFGFALGLFGLGGSFWLTSIGHDWAAIGLGGATLATLVSTFVYGQKKSIPSENSKPS